MPCPIICFLQSLSKSCCLVEKAHFWAMAEIRCWVYWLLMIRGTDAEEVGYDKGWCITLQVWFGMCLSTFFNQNVEILQLQLFGCLMANGPTYQSRRRMKSADLWHIWDVHLCFFRKRAVAKKKSPLRNWERPQSVLSFQWFLHEDVWTWSTPLQKSTPGKSLVETNLLIAPPQRPHGYKSCFSSYWGIKIILI